MSTIFWLFTRTLLRLAVVRATHGGRVLRLMRKAASDTQQGNACPTAPNKRSRLLSQLQYLLPWLPAYDRRDAVTVFSLIASHVQAESLFLSSGKVSAS